MRTLVFVTAFLLLVSVPQALRAAPVLIDFETSPGPDGVLGTSDDIATPAPCVACLPLAALGYDAVGVHFTSGALFADGLFPNHGAGNHYSSSSVPDATLSIPVYGISLSSYSVWSLTLYGFDAAGTLLASSTFNNGTGNFALAELGISSAIPFARFTVRPEGCPPSAPSCNLIVNVDDMVFDTQPPPVAPSRNAAIPLLDGWMLALLAGLIALSGFCPGSVASRSGRRPS